MFVYIADPGAHFHTGADTIWHRHPFAAGAHPYALERAHPESEPIADANGDELEHGKPDFPGQFPAPTSDAPADVDGDDGAAAG
jgi:hypothetical protein